MPKDQEQLPTAGMESDLLQDGTEEGFSSENSSYIGPKVTVEEATTKKPEVKKKKNLTVLKLVVSSVLLVILLLLMVNKREAEAPIFTYISENAMQIHTDQTAGVTFIYNSNGEQLHKINMYTFYYTYNLDHTAAALMVEEKISRISIYSLYYVNSSEVLQLRRGVSYYVISDSGKYIIYTQKQPQGGSALFLYNTQDRTEVEIDSGKQSYSSFCFSPDENTILFASETISSGKVINTKVEGFLISDISSGNLLPVSIGADRLPVAVSDRAEFIYFGLFVNNSTSYLYVKYNDETRKLAENYSKVRLNRDHTEILYNNGTATNICLRGVEIKEVANNTLTGIIMPNKSALKVDYLIRSGTFTYGTESFRNTVIVCDDGSLIFINDQYNPIQIDMIHGEGPIRLSKDGNSVMYMNSKGSVIRVNHLRGSWKTETVLEDIEHWIISEDLSQIYYIQDGNLFYYRDKKEPQHVMDDVDQLFLQANETDIFFLTGKEGEWNLNTCSNGVPKQVEKIGIINAIDYTLSGVAFRQDLSDGTQRYYYPYMSFINDSPD